MKYFLFTFFFFLTFLFYRCANPVTPEGGPKDVKPPRVTSCDPPQSSIHFKDNAIRINFDEFISLKNPTGEIMISPPPKIQPDYRLRGKSIVVKLEDSLAPNTTYTINFGKAILDITENNVLNGYTYIFSTGDYVDSLSLKGKIISAFNLQPQQDVFAMLYIDDNDTIPFDSLPLTIPPYYVTKTDENGEFRFTNLRNEQYKLFALADQNSDLIFNQPSEKIAFCNSLARPEYIPEPVIDTAKTDSTASKTKTDSITQTDTSVHEKKHSLSYLLNLFEEIDSTQRLVKKNLVRNEMVLLVFKYPVKQLSLVLMGPDSLAPKFLQELSSKKDSLTLWITRRNTDSLFLAVADSGKVLDTIKINLLKKEEKRKKDAPAEKLFLTNSARGNSLNQFLSNLEISFSYPLSSWDFSKVILIDEKDTLNPKIEFTDSIHRHIAIHYPWKEEKSYQLIIPDSVFFAFNKLTHDSLIQPFKTRAQKDFGSLILTYTTSENPGPYLFQLLNEKEDILFDQLYADQPGKIQFHYIAPGKYKVKAILDQNRNKRWDTGNYKTKLQPEKVFYLPKTIEVRANWDVEENLDL